MKPEEENQNKFVYPAEDPTAEPKDALVDLTLIEEMSRLTPEERILLNDRMILTIQELRRGFDAR